MATPEDLTANADYIRMADQYVEVSGIPWSGGRQFARPGARTIGRLAADAMQIGSGRYEQQQLRQR